MLEAFSYFFQGDPQRVLSRQSPLLPRQSVLGIFAPPLLAIPYTGILPGERALSLPNLFAESELNAEL